MKSNIFVPKTLNVGFQERVGTYTGKLAYVIYYDQKGALRKETSWNSWKDEKIPTEIYTNEPIEGLVLNKKVGGYASHWNHRQTYVRVYDPRQFEVEISVANLLYILENTSSIKGKGLEGEFVYGWEGSDLVLVPVGTPDYKEVLKFNDIMHNKTHIRGKELKQGVQYTTKSNLKYIFLGKFTEYGYRGEKKKGTSFFFHDGSKYSPIVIRKSLGDFIIAEDTGEIVDNYAELVDQLEKSNYYSPVDRTKDIYVPYTLGEFLARFEDRRYLYCYDQNQKKIEVQTYHDTPTYEYAGVWSNNRSRRERYSGSLEEIYNDVGPTRLDVYLENGKLHQEGY